MEIDTCKGRRLQLASVLALLVSTKGRFPPFLLRILKHHQYPAFRAFRSFSWECFAAHGCLALMVMTVLSS